MNCLSISVVVQKAAGQRPLCSLHHTKPSEGNQDPLAVLSERLLLLLGRGAGGAVDLS